MPYGCGIPNFKGNYKNGPKVYVFSLLNDKNYLMFSFIQSKEIVAERASNHHLVRELFWSLEFRIYIFRPMRMTDAILPGEVTRGT